jgi:beta-glucosidase
MQGTEIVQLYFNDIVSTVVRPCKELAGFKRVFLRPGETKKVAFTFAANQTAFVDKDMKWRVEAGEIELMIGNSSENFVPAGTLTISETITIVKSRRNYYSEADVI